MSHYAGNCAVSEDPSNMVSMATVSKIRVSQNFNIFHASVGNINCCAFVEIFPIDDINKRLNFHKIRGYGNIARHLGLSYFRYEANNEQDQFIDGKDGGTRLHVDKVINVIKEAVRQVSAETSCINV